MIISQKTTTVPSESPSDHVSVFFLAMGGAPNRFLYDLLISASVLCMSRRDPPSVFCVLDFVLLASWAQPPSLFPDKFHLQAAFCSGCQSAGEAASGIGGQPSAAPRFVCFYLSSASLAACLLLNSHACSLLQTRTTLPSMSLMLSKEPQASGEKG